MNESFVEVSGIRTKVSTWGRWIEESKPDKNEIIIIIPGNPGITGFYKSFARTLWKKTEIPVWCVGHAGHNFSKKSLTTFPKFKDNKHLYGLEAQVQHKIDFLKKYVPTDTKVYLIGHSIGAYICLEILNDEEINNKIECNFLLFPTIEYMAETRNGKVLINLAKPFVPCLIFLSWIFTLLPNFFATFLLYAYMNLAHIPVNLHIENIKDLIKPGILRRVFFLAYEEMAQVRQRNDKIINENLNKIRFLYSHKDKWAPESYYNKLLNDIPDAMAKLCDINHSFVLNASEEVADYVSKWINGEK